MPSVNKTANSSDKEIKLLAKFVETLPNPIIRIHADGKIMFSNVAGKKLLECWTTTVGGFVSDEWKYIVSDCIILQQQIDREIVCNDNTFNLTITPFSKDNYVDVFGLNVTEERKNRTRLQLFRYLLDQSNDAVFVVDPLTGKFIDVNETACKELGYSRDTIVMMEIQDVDCKLTSKKSIKQFISSVKRKESMVIESLLHRRDGSTIMVELSCKYITKHQTNYIVITSRDITERKNTERVLKDLAFKDTLTGLSNRRMFEEQINHQSARSRRQKQPYALILLDLDDFSTVNNTLGHKVGDELLKSIANRMKQIFRRETDVVARLGGDEFVILITEFDNKTSPKEQCESMCKNLVSKLEPTHNLGSDVLSVTASVGCALVMDSVVTAEDLTRIADEAMYVAKKAGKNSFHIVQG